jgi:carbonic anhydrase
MRAYNKESLEKTTPTAALEYLKKGNDRFLQNLKIDRNLLKQVIETSEGQFPFATILSCIDSRTSAELIFDQGLGDIFSIRIAGNILNDDILGSMEFACGIANSKIIVVLGHTKCGAVIGACNNYRSGYLTGLLDKINPAIELENTIKTNRNGKNLKYVNRVSEINVRLVIEKIREKSTLLNSLEKEGKIIIIGAFYEVETGKVSFFEN